MYVSVKAYIFPYISLFRLVTTLVIVPVLYVLSNVPSLLILVIYGDSISLNDTNDPPHKILSSGCINNELI